MFDLPIFHNERDVELPLLRQFLRKNGAFLSSVLDIGPWEQGSTKICVEEAGYVDAIDPVRWPEVEKMVGIYYQENFLLADLPYYDFVVCVSTLEHIGVTPLPTKLYRECQIEAFAKILEIIKRGAFITFPYGEDDFFAGQYYNGNRKLLDDYLKLARNFKVYKKFISTPDHTDPESWREIPQDLADKATNELSGGVNTICVLEVYK